MNKKILISLSVIAAVAALAIGGTIAYFSDVETSTGNTFTAGELDLIVDIDGVPYNPLNGRPFFELDDMKPGDSGEETISLTVEDNPACGFVDINITTDLDNSCNEPEETDEPSCKLDNVGELNDTIVWAIWLDMGRGPIPDFPTCEHVYPGDNKYNPECGDVPLTEGTLTGNESWSIGELDDTTKYYGVAYCFGTWNSMTCDGSQLDNESQSDSFTGDIIFRAEQKRNQDFGSRVGVCPPVGEYRD